MKRYFENRLAAIDWIAIQAENEAQFEVMREELTFNFIYSGTYFLEQTECPAEVILLDRSDS